MKTVAILSPTDSLDKLVKIFLPPSLDLLLHQIIVDSSELTLMMTSSRLEAHCPLCGQPTTRVHSRYTRTLQDLPWSTLRVRLCIQVHRFFCENASCARRIFTEQLPELAERYARRTNRLCEALLALGWALGGEAAARQCTSHAMPICGATILALLRRCGAEVSPTPRVLGVDDWSFQARTAATLLVDLEQHRPVEVLLGSDESVLSDWLLAHPGVEVISRDRGASYLKGCKWKMYIAAFGRNTCRFLPPRAGKIAPPTAHAEEILAVIPNSEAIPCHHFEKYATLPAFPSGRII